LAATFSGPSGVTNPAFFDDALVAASVTRYGVVIVAGRKKVSHVQNSGFFLG
jgi:hypothetical protein